MVITVVIQSSAFQRSNRCGNRCTQYTLTIVNDFRLQLDRTLLELLRSFVQWVQWSRMELERNPDHGDLFAKSTKTLCGWFICDPQFAIQCKTNRINIANIPKLFTSESKVQIAFYQNFSSHFGLLVAGSLLLSILSIWVSHNCSMCGH